MKFAKYQALGTDYLVVEQDEFLRRGLSSAIRRICDRHFEIGADSILVRESSIDSNKFLSSI